MTDEKSEYYKLKISAGLIGILASIFIIIGVIVNVYTYLPEWLIWSVFIFIAIVILWLLSHPVSNFIKNKGEIRELNVLARKYFGELKTLLERFDEFISNRNDNIPHVLQDLSRSVTTKVVDGPDKREFEKISILRVEPFYDLFINLQKRFEFFNGTKGDFLLLAQEFDTILNIYNRFHICKPVEEIRKIGRKKVPEEIKENYNKYKRKYERFIEDYTNFAKKINNKFGFGERNIITAYLEMPKEL